MKHTTKIESGNAPWPAGWKLEDYLRHAADALRIFSGPAPNGAHHVTEYPEFYYDAADGLLNLTRVVRPMLAGVADAGLRKRVHLAIVSLEHNLSRISGRRRLAAEFAKLGRGVAKDDSFLKDFAAIEAELFQPLMNLSHEVVVARGEEGGKATPKERAADDERLTVGRCATLLKVSQKTIQRMIRDGVLPSHTVGKRGRRVWKSDLMRSAK